ncbi:MAG TPA: DUF262 domain-containing protein [Ktedonobacterales bacterium]
MGISAQDKEIQSLVNDIKEGRLLLPEMQRGYVWKSTQVRDLFDSLYHEYPTGQLLVWQTDELPHAHAASVQGVEQSAYRPQLLLDGQQRLTSLTAIMFGQPLLVRDRSRTVDIVFNVHDERFAVATAVHHPQAGWVSLTKLFTKGTMTVFGDLRLDLSDPNAQLAHDRLSRINAIKQYRYRVNVLEGLSYEKVTEIFVRINSGGTRLNSADLTLAQISSRWYGVTDELAAYREKIKRLGWELDNAILLRVLTAILTKQTTLGQLFRSGREKLTVADLQAAWQRSKPAMDQAIYFLQHNCLIDRFSMMTTDYVLVPLAVFFDRFSDGITEQQIRSLRRWVYMAVIWSRYTGATDTNLNQDVAAVTRDDDLIGRMIENIEDKVGRNRLVTERDLQDEFSNSPFMLMAYVLARQSHAQDWFNGIAIGGSQSLEYHHIFPRSLLAGRYESGARRRMVNQIANLAFISGRANGAISAKPPEVYLPTIEDSRLRAQYVPTDQSLWPLERFEDFLRARRTLLADGINQLLQTLTDTPMLVAPTTIEVLRSRVEILERQLRDVIAQRLSDSFGSRAWRQGVPGDAKQSIEERIATRLRQHPYEADQYESLDARLAFGQFSDYTRIITANWELFEDIFHDRQNFDRHLRDVQNVRNALAHHRETARSELSHADGGLAWLEDCLRYATRVASIEDGDGEEGDDEADLVSVAAQSGRNLDR